MVWLKELHISAFRNLDSVSLCPSNQFNCIVGSNGSGKTSCLEAVHLLGFGRSFRARQAQRYIQHGHQETIVRGLVAYPDSNKSCVPLGVSRACDNSAVFKVSGQSVRPAAVLAQYLPLLLISPDTRQLLLSGPLARRRFIDWGVFYLNPGFLEDWWAFNRLLKQRNAALKRGVSQLDHWNAVMGSLAERMHACRARFIDLLRPMFSEYWSLCSGLPSVDFLYSRGWVEHDSYVEVLRKSEAKDRLYGYTQWGPHRADLRLLSGRAPVAEVLSQGQQKLLVYMLKLAQGGVLAQTIGLQSVYLVDDLPAELDRHAQQLVLDVLMTLKGQVFITGVDLTACFQGLQSHADVNMFHVEHGCFEKVGL